MRARQGSSAGCRPTRGSRAGSCRYNRDYDATTGTFLSPDPLDGDPGTPDEANPNDYVDNDPLNHTDPLGLCRMTDGDFVFEQNRSICEDARANATSTSGCRWGDSDTAFYDWDPFNSISYGDDSGCKVTLGDGSTFGELWTVSSRGTDCIVDPHCWVDGAALGLNTFTGLPQAAAVEILGNGDCFLDTDHWNWTCAMETDNALGGSNCITTFGLVRCPNDRDPGSSVLAHEDVHADQQGVTLEVGFYLFGIFIDLPQSRYFSSRDGRDAKCHEILEQWAGLEDGGYTAENGYDC